MRNKAFLDLLYSAGLSPRSDRHGGFPFFPNASCTNEIIYVELRVLSSQLTGGLSLKVLSQGSNVGVSSRGAINYCVEGCKPHSIRLSGQE